MSGCATCGATLPPGFPGASVTCTNCGAAATLPPPSTKRPSVAGPYRGGVTGDLAADQQETLCPYCSNRCPPLVRVCPHCDVRLDSVRCARCYSLQPPGSFSCGRCGQALELEALLDATDAPCPRCRSPLEAVAEGAIEKSDVRRAEDQRVQECPRCGGMFVPREALAEILCQAELAGPFVDPRTSVPPPLEQVTYVQCPLCHSSMNRVNFGKLSGVIVDVCRKHGTWFDAGELTRVVAFAAGGGLAKSRAREEADNKEAAAKDATLKRALVNLHVASSRERWESEEQLRRWESFLRNIFFWT